MKKIVLLAVLLALVTAVNAEGRSFRLFIEYDQGMLNLTQLDVMDVEAPVVIEKPEGGYTLSLYSDRDEVLYVLKFNFPLAYSIVLPKEYFDERGNQVIFPSGDEVGGVANTTTVILSLPFYENAAKMQVTDPEGRIVLDVDVREYTGIQASTTTVVGPVTPPAALTSSTSTSSTSTSSSSTETTLETQETTPTPPEQPATLNLSLYAIAIVLIILVLVYEYKTKNG